jgi:hypothetical protein
LTVDACLRGLGRLSGRAITVFGKACAPRLRDAGGHRLVCSQDGHFSSRTVSDLLLRYVSPAVAYGSVSGEPVFGDDGLIGFRGVGLT